MSLFRLFVFSGRAFVFWIGFFRVSGRVLEVYFFVKTDRFMGSCFRGLGIVPIGGPGYRTYSRAALWVWKINLEVLFLTTSRAEKFNSACLFVCLSVRSNLGF